MTIDPLTALRSPCGTKSTASRITRRQRRHFGLLANGVKARRLLRARSLLGTPAPPEPFKAEPESWQDADRRLAGKDPLLPACRVGRLVVVADIPRPPIPPHHAFPSRSP